MVGRAGGTGEPIHGPSFWYGRQSQSPSRAGGLDFGSSAFAWR